MTKDELIELRRERGKQELNIGDRVKVYDRDGNIMYGGKVAIIIEKALLDPSEFYYGLYVEGETVDKFYGYSLLQNPHGSAHNAGDKIGKTALLAPFFAEDLELMREPTPEINVGDIVKVKADAPDKGWSVEAISVTPTRYKFQPFEVVQIEKVGLKIMAYADSLDGFMHICIPICYLEPYYSAEDVRRMEEEQNKRAAEFLREHSGKEDKPHTDTITIPVKADLDDTYWDAYRAELVKELAVKVANNNTINDSMIPYHIISFATQIVDNLKKQSE